MRDICLILRDADENAGLSLRMRDGSHLWG